MRVYLDHTETVAANTTTFWFRTDSKPDYVAGQFIELTLPGIGHDNRGHKRWFTLSSSPTENLLSITTRRATSQSSTFKQALFALTPGSPIAMSEPMGDFVLPKDITIPLLFIAAGIGITPVRSMLKWLLDSGQKRNVHIIYAARTIHDIAFLNILTAYSVHMEIILSEPPKEWDGRKGRITPQVVLPTINKIRPLTYISGPELLVERLQKGLLTAGIPPEQLAVDFFHGYDKLL